MGVASSSLRTQERPPYFQRRMDEVLKDLPFCRCYIDDIIIWSTTLEEHLLHLHVVFDRLREAGLKENAYLQLKEQLCTQQFYACPTLTPPSSLPQIGANGEWEPF